MDYFALKHTHVTCVVLSYTLFFIRGIWMMRGSGMLARRWVKIVPHVVDTILLASAIWLAILIRQYPFVQPWLTAKVLGLIAYVAIGTVALKRGRSRRMRIGAWIAAQAVFFYIVAVAITKNPAPWM